ncbi:MULTISPECIES: neuraminidase-like domain-containing protein [Cyanophyceae]|uniref:neuraminidase-like domain-containing protein n=1 Tax=Cyanophyceae TaxID=3028117 RepID=UPI0016881350|nr:neuraminidase-like domain-containing protein [Trichocoleus sp. FACHB-69]MBD1930312.1 PA14 domain-containing protein,virulence plasmid 28 protein [Trichocoleus sp. FACHB-69]
MQRIIAPLQSDDRGPTVANLQDALQLFLDRRLLLANDEGTRQKLSAVLGQERVKQSYQEVTRELVSIFQAEQQIQPQRERGNVDERTADVMNRLLQELGELDQPQTETFWVVSGRIQHDNELPFKGGIVRAFHQVKQDAIRLGEDRTDPEGRYTIRYTPLPGINTINLRVNVSNDDLNILQSSDVIPSAKPIEIVNLMVSISQVIEFQVEGKVSSPTSISVGDLIVQVVDKNVGEDEEDVLLNQTVTQADGTYQVTFNDSNWRQRGKTKPDLQTRVLAGERILAVSEVRYNASSRELLNVLLTETVTPALQSEHETLLQNLASHFQGNLRHLQETDTRQDITYLGNKTNWDVRAVAIAALADQFSSRTEIAPAFFYSLFRAGVPANEDALYQIDAQTAESVWKQGIQQGVIPATLEAQLPQVVELFRGLSAQHTLDAPALAGVSSLKEMLTSGQINDLQQQQFVNLYTRHRDNLPQFWDAVQRDLGKPVAQRLRVDGQLGYLTLNNAPLLQSLHQDIGGVNGITDPLSLIENGYYQAEKWQTLMTNGVTIPPEIPGKDVAEKRSNYAELMSAQMRLSYPTAVVAQMVRTGETPLKNAVGEQVHALLMEQHGNFEIGLQPIEQFALQNNLQIAPEVMQEVTRIQRVHQITTSDDARNTLLRNNLDSAYKVVQYDQADFVQQFKDELGGEINAILTHAKAQQVHNTVLNIATSYLTGRNAPAIGSNLNGRIINSLSGPPVNAAANAADIIAYPTLENLFGEMDYCTCDHCRSILSPAAYLVNLLQFCDPPGIGVNTPLKILLERRPDIQHLPLTCENTNTPLPYIDIVNETLEYFITHNLKLDNYTGHDINTDATSEELLASPQFVSDQAYQTLAGKPIQVGDPLPLLPPSPPLPFHQPLENLRRYFDQFEIPLPIVMAALRKNDDLERASETEYGWHDILMEELRISRAEYRLLSDRTLTLQHLYGYSPATPEADILSTLANAKAFTRQSGISYEEIIEIIKTRFVNPNAVLIPKLEQLRVPFATLKAFKDGAIADADFDALIPAELDATQYGGDIKAWVRDDANHALIMGLITLTNPTAVADPCRFDQLEFRYANPDNNTNQVRPFEFIRLIRFIRLWKKLGWSIAQTDQAIAALYPADQIPNDSDDAINLEKLDAGFLILLPRLGVIKQVMTTLNLELKKDLLPLLACFASIDTYGTSLYRQMFLSPALLKQDAIFADDGFGNFLTNPAQTLVVHTEALRAALHLTEDELRQIMTALGYDDNTPLSLETLSAIFRRGWLARILKLSVREFLVLAQFTGFDPFAAPDPFHPPIQRFIGLVQQLRTLSLKPVQALYLIWNQDISGKSVPNDSKILGFARNLRAALTAIEDEYTVTDDPDGQIARSRMALVYGNAATDLFFGLLNNTLVSTVPYSHGQAALETAITDVVPSQIVYDDFRKQMTFTGVLTSVIRDALQSIPSVTPQFQTAIADLYDKNQKVIQPFFARYPELLPLYEIYIAATDPAEQKRSALLANFLPELKRRRKQQQGLQLMSAVTKVEAEMTNALLDNATVLHAANATSQTALNDLITSETFGLSAQFFFRDTVTGDVNIARDAELNLAYSTAEQHPLPVNAAAPDSAISGIWSGYLEAPENGFYNISIEADAGATVALMLAGKALPLTPIGNLWRNDQPIDLRAGSLYAIALTVEKVKATLIVRWQTIGRGWEVIPASSLYSDTLTKHLRITYVRFLKAAALAIALKLTASEIAYFTAHTDYQIGGQGWLNSLPVNGSPDNTAAIALRDAFTALLDFAHLKAELSPDDERLLTLLQDPNAALQPDPEKGPESSLLFRLTRWEERSRNALLNHFGVAIADLTHLLTFRRFFDAYAPIRALGIPASTLLNTATNEPNATTVRNLQSALRARYDESDWLKALKPINDEMRGLQRNALVAYILHQMRVNPTTAHIDTPDKLFEYFLMDVQMEPCMQTSRIRHALSSVQLFIERCLMNLEAGVSPSAINAKQWSWMERYRLWEANCKVFLYPENWLEPELRDDQSPFFKEAMSELLQGDITEDRAAVTLLNYLSKLEEVAKLEPCGIHFVENDLTKLDDDIAHVVARTPGANRKYFYRRREYGYWTHWEQIKLDIEDNPVIPVIWKDRLFLFWLRIIKQAPLNTSRRDSSTAPEDNTELAEVNLRQIRQSVRNDSNTSTKVTVQAVLCWSEYYNGKWQATKTSDIDKPNSLGEFNVAGEDAFERSTLSLYVYEFERKLVVRILGSKNERSKFVLYNTHSLPVLDNRGLPDQIEEAKTVDLTISQNTFSISYCQVGSDYKRQVIKTQIDGRLVKPHHYPENGWTAPFFYEDSRHVFYVSTSERPVTISEFAGYGVVGYLSKKKLDIPPLVLESQPIIRDRLGPISMDSRIAVVDLAPMKQFVTEDAYIKKGIVTTGTVRFGDKDISATGILRNQQIQ